MSKVSPIPAGYHSITPYLVIDGAAKAIDFYKQAFGATEIMRFEEEGKVHHAELKIGDSIFMLADEMDGKCASPKKLGNSTVGMLLYVENVDAVFAKANAAGAKVVRPLENMFYGDRTGTLEDPFGHKWTVSTHVEDVTEEQVKERLEKAKA